MSTYANQLKHPLWQKKRLKIMERDGFSCRICSATEKTLNVHHNYYRGFVEPWIYSDRALFTLCENCHKKEENEKTADENRLINSLRYAGALNHDLRRITLLIEEISDHGEDTAGLPMIEHVLSELASAGVRQ